MDFKELFKFQMISGSMQGAVGGPASGQSFMSDPLGMIWQVGFMIAIGFADELTKQLPGAIAMVKEKYISKFLQKQITEKLDSSPEPISAKAVPLDKKHFMNSLSMSRVYSQKDKNSDRGEEMNAMIDAVLDSAARLNNVPSFRLIESAQTMINYKDQPIQLTRDIYLRLDNVEVSTEGCVEKVELTLCSNTLPAAEISKHVRHLHHLRKEEMKNALGDNVYYFDQKSRDSDGAVIQPNVEDEKQAAAQMQNAKRMMIKTASKQLMFTKTAFYSNKQFSNIVGDEVRLIEKRVKFFLKRKDWYDSKGVPYQLGLMLSGLPGTGKTSVIRAIANLTGRHIINVNFANITTATQLKNLFFSEKLSVYNDSSMSDVQSYLVPIDRRIYVLEEIDAVGDIVKQRCGEAKAALPDELTLGEILTVLDGTMESPGRIVVMTSNHPDTLDAALIRPGRIDVAVEFGNATLRQIGDMYNSFYDDNIGELKNLPESLDKQLSPAEVGQVFFRHFDDPEPKSIVKDLISTVQKKAITEEKRAAASRRMSKEAEDADTESKKAASGCEEDSPEGADPKTKDSEADPSIDQHHLQEKIAGQCSTGPNNNREDLGDNSMLAYKVYNNLSAQNDLYVLNRLDNTESISMEMRNNMTGKFSSSQPRETDIQAKFDPLSLYKNVGDSKVKDDPIASVYDADASNASLDSYFAPPLPEDPRNQLFQNNRVQVPVH